MISITKNSSLKPQKNEIVSNKIAWKIMKNITISDRLCMYHVSMKYPGDSFSTMIERLFLEKK